MAKTICWYKRRSNKIAKSDFEKDFFKLMDNVVEESIMQLLEKLWKMRKNIVILNLSQQKEEETIWCQNQVIILQMFAQKYYYNRNEKAEIRLNKPVYFGLLKLELSKILMYEFWYDYAKPKYVEKQSCVKWIHCSCKNR